MNTPDNVKEVGLVLPVHIRPGKRVSGSVVEDPADYENTPEVMVTRFALPFAASGSAAKLSGWQVEISGEPPQPADGPIALTVPAGQIGLAVLFRQSDNAGTPVSKVVNLGASKAKGASSGKNKAGAYLAPAICVKDQLCIVSGPFNGNSSQTFAAFETRPAKIIAESSTALYLAIPDATEPGPRPLAIAEGAKAIAFPMVVAEFTLEPGRRDLPAGEKLLLYPTVEGAGDLPDPEWRPGNFPASNLEQARKLIPGYQPPTAASAHEKREAEERREKAERAAAKSGASDAGAKPDSDEDEGGELLLVIKNLTPATADFRDSKDGMYVFHLNAASFKMGDFKYKFVVQAKQTGNFGAQGWLIPFLAPVTGQEFPMTAVAK